MLAITIPLVITSSIIMLLAYLKTSSVAVSSGVDAVSAINGPKINEGPSPY